VEPSAPQQELEELKARVDVLAKNSLNAAVPAVTPVSS
jgi:hypothetical protein